MKAISYAHYGPPDVLRLVEMDRPSPGDDEIRVRIHAAAVTTVDCIFRRGDQFAARLFTGPFKPKHAILGALFSGEVDVVGEDVRRFREGDLVFGATRGFGAYAEYICVPEDGIVDPKPAALRHEQAAAIGEGALTALPFLRDSGEIQEGHEVLINGASGSVGTAAVQLARHFGADVTGVCSGKNAEMVKQLGAERVVDYTKEDFTQSGRIYDIIFDTIGTSSFSKCKGSLKPDGVFLSPVIGPGILFQMLRTSLMGSKRARFAATGARPADQQALDLRYIRKLLETGELTAVVDRIYDMEEAVEAHRYVEGRHKKGNVVLVPNGDSAGRQSDAAAAIDNLSNSDR